MDAIDEVRVHVGREIRGTVRKLAFDGVVEELVRRRLEGIFCNVRLEVESADNLCYWMGSLHLAVANPVPIWGVTGFAQIEYVPRLVRIRVE